MEAMPFRPGTRGRLTYSRRRGKGRTSAFRRSALRLDELCLKLPMHITATLVLLHGPQEERLAAARLFPSFPDILLLLLVLDKMLALVLRARAASQIETGNRQPNSLAS
jgi:hypothetical protein